MIGKHKKMKRFLVLFSILLSSLTYSQVVTVIPANDYRSEFTITEEGKFITIESQDLTSFKYLEDVVWVTLGNGQNLSVPKASRYFVFSNGKLTFELRTSTEGRVDNIFITYNGNRFTYLDLVKVRTQD